MSKRMLQLITVLTASFALMMGQMEQVVNSFDAAPADTNYWAWFEQISSGNPDVSGHYQVSDNADSELGWINVDYIGDPVQVGDGAIQMEWSAHNIEGWGGYSKLEHWHPDSLGVYDFSNYDSISFWYYNAVPQSDGGSTHFRFNLQECSDSPNGPNTTNVADVEYYYSFHYVLDNEPGWNKITMPIENGANWSGEGFNLTGWSGIVGNETLDKDQIKGFSFEFSIGGAGEGNYSQGTFIVDHLALVGPSEVELIFFNGMAVPNDVTLNQPWSGSVVVTDADAFTPETNSLLWSAGAQWAGPIFALNNPANMFVSWEIDSVQFKIKAPAELGQLRLHFSDTWEDTEGDFPFEAHYMLEPEDVGYDGTWKEVKIAMADFDLNGGYWNVDHLEEGVFDYNAVGAFGILASGGDYSGLEIYLDEMWTGDPEVDVIGSDPPTGVTAIPSDYYNLVIWQDVEGEEGEVYNVYASQSPIVDLEDSSVDLVASAVLEGLQTGIHYLKYPLMDTNVDYYYAVTCTDMAGNVSDPGFSAMVSNTAKGIPTISLTVPSEFMADGDLSEWYDSDIMPFELYPEDYYVPAPGTVDDSDDLYGTIWMAIDDDNLYLAGDVFDDVYHLGEGNWWDNDAFQFYFGLYDWRGPKHTAYNRGAEPDYGMYVNENTCQLDAPTNTQVWENMTEHFYFEGFNPDYIFEVAIPLDTLAARGGDTRFYPGNGMRIAMELYFHDNDGAGWEGNLGMSPYNTDLAWQSPTQWTYSWIGDQDGYCAPDGDVNEDGNLDILDVVQVVGVILGTVDLGDAVCHADANTDGSVDILDVVILVDLILNPPARADLANNATVINDEGQVTIEADGIVGGVQLVLTHGDDFSIDLTNNALIADSHTENGKTTVVVVNPEGDLFTATGSFVIEDAVAASGNGYVDVEIAGQYALLSSYPNPFNPVANINFYIPSDSNVKVGVYNILGQQVATLTNDFLSRGSYSVQWNGTSDLGQSMASGIYFVKMDHSGGTLSQKVTLLK